ncbi:MAG: twin-arginine translocase subunit TatC [Candidatus Levybacteria bacterium]|nr:twin-arginine translocase subunit TatC [Candidatus Levybacteria bacterium]
MPEPVVVDDTDTAKYLPFLLEIRRRLFFTVSIFAVACVIGFIFYEKIIKFVLNVFHLDGVNIVFTSPFQFINLAIQSSLIVGFIIVFPIIVYQLIAFIRPALSQREFKNILFLFPLSLILFITGFSYGIIIMRYTVAIFYEKSVQLDIGNLLDVSAFISQTLMTSILLGVAFQFPIIITFLLRTKMVNRNFFAKKRIFFYAASLIFATFLPPTDILSLVFLFAPLIALFEATLLFNRLFKHK